MNYKLKILFLCTMISRVTFKLCHVVNIFNTFPVMILFACVAAKLISFSQLCTLLSQPTKEPSILRCVQQYAVMVQGCWVVKSELLYPANTISPHSGVPAEILCRGRDYIVSCLTDSLTFFVNFLFIN